MCRSYWRKGDSCLGLMENQTIWLVDKKKSKRGSEAVGDRYFAKENRVSKHDYYYLSKYISCKDRWTDNLSDSRCFCTCFFLQSFLAILAFLCDWTPVTAAVRNVIIGDFVKRP